MLLDALDELDFELLGLLLGFGRPEELFQDIRVHDERVEVVADDLDVDVLVDELDRLRAERVPEQLPLSARRLNRLVDLGEPDVVARYGAEQRVGGAAPPNGGPGTSTSAANASRMSLFGRHSWAASRPS